MAGGRGFTGAPRGLVTSLLICFLTGQAGGEGRGRRPGSLEACVRPWGEEDGKGL